MRFRKVIKLGIVSVTMKALLLGSLVVGTFNSTVRAERQCWGIELYDTCFCGRIDAIDDVGIYKPPRGTKMPLRCINKSRLYDAKAKPDRADVTGITRCVRKTCPPSCGGNHGAVLDSAAKTRSGKLIDRSSSTRTTPRGKNSYRRGAAGANGALDGKVTVCEGCGGSCTSCSCRGGFTTGIRVRPGVAGQKYAENCSKCGWRMFENHVCNPTPSPARGGKSGPRVVEGLFTDIGGHLLVEASGIATGRGNSLTRQVSPVRRAPVRRSAAGRPQPRENNLNRQRPAPSRGVIIQEQLKGVKSLNRFRR